MNQQKNYAEMPEQAENWPVISEHALGHAELYR